ncbi:MAG TPA: hypothetical protein VIX81_08930 [Gammaproteobacteria bacterium]
MPRLAPLLAALALAACSAAPERVAPPPPIDVSDARAAPSGPAKRAEAGGVRYYLGDNYFEADVVALLHNRIALRAAPRPTPTRLELTDLELSVFDPGGSGAVGIEPPGQGSAGYRPAPGPLVFDFHDRESPKPIRCELAYRVDGREYREQLAGSARPEMLRAQLRELYLAAIDRVIARLRDPARSG